MARLWELSIYSVYFHCKYMLTIYSFSFTLLFSFPPFQIFSFVYLPFYFLSLSFCLSISYFSFVLLNFFKQHFPRSANKVSLFGVNRLVASSHGKLQHACTSISNCVRLRSISSLATRRHKFWAKNAINRDPNICIWWKIKFNFKPRRLLNIEEPVSYIYIYILDEIMSNRYPGAKLKFSDTNMMWTLRD